jgi:hypothetical protein
MRVSDLVKDLIFLIGSMECFAQVSSFGYFGPVLLISFLAFSSVSSVNVLFYCFKLRGQMR